MSPTVSRRRVLAMLAGSAAGLAAGPAAARLFTDPHAVIGRANGALAAMRAGPSGELLSFLLPRCEGVMVFPALLRAGLILGGEGGNGVLLGRSDAMGWSQPAFVAIGSGSVGFQLGVQRSRLLLVIMDPATLRRALDTGLRLGVDVNAVIGRDGIAAGLDTQQAFENVYAFPESDSGVFIGVSLEGSVIGMRDALNEAYYGRKVRPRDIVLERTVWNASANGLIATLSA
jgi:SH3 domain-containing YSC84-like protein 1